MRKATQKEIDKFVQYRANHVALVQRIGKVLFNMDFSDHDRDKIECDADDLNLYSLRNAMLDGGYRPSSEDKVILNNLAGRHVKSQKHHPEYWDEAITVDSFNYEDPVTTDASRMPVRSIIELACDWSAVAIKLNKSIFQWYNTTCTGDSPRFRFAPAQRCILLLCLKRVQDNIKEEKLYYPGIDYKAKQVEPVLDSGVIDCLKRWSEELKL